jgi:hypothetical protein
MLCIKEREGKMLKVLSSEMDLGSGLKWSHSKGHYERERRGDFRPFKVTAPPPTEIGNSEPNCQWRTQL